MKKSLIALAALAVVGAASAQSSVTIDGNVQLGVVKNTGSSAQLNAANGANQIRFRGTEDLGGGLKANFALAQRFSPESGRADGTANNRPTFQGESTVGLSGGFGSIKLGRALTALQGPVNSTDPWGTWTVGSVAVVPGGYNTDNTANVDGEGAGRTDAIFYASPNFNGFSAAVSLGLKNSAASGASVTHAKNLVSFWASYANGPLMVGGGVEQNRRDDDVTVILGTYNFGAVKLGAGYGQVDTVAIAGAKRKNYNLMATAPMGAFTLKAGYGNSKAEGTQVKTTKLGLGGEYALSKRTYLYTTFARNKVGSASATNGFDLGVNHSF
jgi:predicted porin